jgi:hypothetical protein
VAATATSEATTVATGATIDATTGAATAATTEGQSDRPEAPLRTGIAGLIPPHHPSPSDDDWRDFFSALPALGGTVGNYAALEDLDANQSVGELAGVHVLPVTGFHRDLGAGLEVTHDFADPAQAAAFTALLVDFAQAHQPPYLGVGNEVNRVWEDEPAAFDAWVEALPALIDAVHAVSPDTLVFATFQYEFLRGFDDVTGRGRVEDWTPLDRVAPLLDLVAFTTYPYFGQQDPAALPDDYYAPAVEHAAGRPVGFTEVGWPSEAIAPFVGTAVEGFGGTPEEQAAFIARLPSLLGAGGLGVEPRFVMWVWAFDTPVVGDVFGSLGLAENDGNQKPALDAWLDFVGTRQRQ